MSEEAIENKLGTKITTLREAHHLTQQDLADRCQCDIETIRVSKMVNSRLRLHPLSRSRVRLACASAPSWTMTRPVGHSTSRRSR